MSILTPPPPAPGAPALGRVWSRVDTRRLARLLVVVGALHLLGWGALLLARGAPRRRR